MNKHGLHTEVRVRAILKFIIVTQQTVFTIEDSLGIEIRSKLVVGVVIRHK